ncbi:FMN reductase (NADH) NtaB [Vibrio thalassae]|uniref:FMN reductase (NADH) NtaB n=1 Tax=Vibrio thalassae TaxID=1243014 RepID=A0A240EMW3_9VIBR|nr:flavin reductase family protein [Vibrio thalassae]SNX49998.1 FMN reductase (NADH) NtaB [Vibrio thalassae]
MSKDYKNALSCFATGVAVITTRHNNVDYGLTCSSFNSVSINPALVLWSLNHGSSTKAPIVESNGYTVSILAADQADLAMKFCLGDHEQRFEGVPVVRAPSGRAIIEGAIAWFDCELHESIPAGDHDIMLGHVQKYASKTGEGLVFERSRFGVVQHLVTS